MRLSCKFCSFYRKRGEDGAYEMPVEQVVATAARAAEAGATEVHIVGGLHPWLKFDYYLQMLAGIRRECPNLHIKAFTAIEIIHLSRVARMSIAEVLTPFARPGWAASPAAGRRFSTIAFTMKSSRARSARTDGLKFIGSLTNWGSIPTRRCSTATSKRPQQRVGHMMKLRQLQDESLSAMQSAPDRACFNCVIPLSFIPENSELGYLPGPTGLTDLKTLAIARLMIDNIAHIKAFWIMQSVGLSQLAMNWGCDDLDGTVVWYDITKREGHGVHQELHVARHQAPDPRGQKNSRGKGYAVSPGAAGRQRSPLAVGSLSNPAEVFEKL